MKHILYPSDSRGTADHGWLKSKHSFSFAEYQNPERINFGALRVLNDDLVIGGAGFGTHPHNNMEIITIVLSGALEHKDSMGNIGVIRDNEVQVMSAGKGLQHSEYNHSASESVSFFQLWIIPNERNVVPRYEQKQFDWNAVKNAWQNVVTSVDEKDGLWIHQKAWIFRGKFDAGTSTNYQLKNKNNGVFVMVISGSVKISENILNKRDAIGMADMTEFSLISIENSDVLLIEIPLFF